MEKEIKCPRCENGYLGELTKEEKSKLSTKFDADNILGCDECQYWTHTTDS